MYMVANTSCPYLYTTCGIDKFTNVSMYIIQVFSSYERAGGFYMKDQMDVDFT